MKRSRTPFLEAEENGKRTKLWKLALHLVNLFPWPRPWPWQTSISPENKEHKILALPVSNDAFSVILGFFDARDLVLVIGLVNTRWKTAIQHIPDPSPWCAGFNNSP